MKKSILIISTLAIVAAGVFTGCTKKQFDEKFNDPEKTTEATIDGLYSGLFSNRRVFPDYWNTRTILAEITGRYTQSVGFLPNAGMYEPNPSYVQDRWNDLYTAAGTNSNWTAPIANFREMERIYNGLEDEAEKQGYLLFMETARIFVYDQATRSVDFWGDIPFSKAGLLNLNGSLELASYDEAAAIYDDALTNLKRISDWLASVQPDPFYMTTLNKHDMLCKGDLLKWRRYANSLILRLAMRISYVQEDRARRLVQEILSNPTKYPVVEVFTDNVELTAAAPNRVTDLFTAWNENDGNLAPGYMVDSLMKPSGDPRLRLLYTTNRNGDYQGIATSWTNTQATAAIGAGLVSRLDTVTFTRNQSFPGIVMTASEVWFLKAEAFQRWTGGIAKNAYENGIRQSINYYYDIHKRSTYGVRETAPTDAEFTLLIAHPLVAYGTDPESNLNKIALQKWISFGPMQSDQTWSEMRRSGYPKISVPTDVSSQILPTPPARFLYPSTERNLNDKNYEAVAGKDKYDAKIFWAR
jgi:hypothetical protein